MVNDDGLDDLIDVGLAGHWILPIWNVHQRGPEADGQVVGIHHVLIAVLRQAASTTVREPWCRLSPFAQKSLPPTSPHRPRKQSSLSCASSLNTQARPGKAKEGAKYNSPWQYQKGLMQQRQGSPEKRRARRNSVKEEKKDLLIKESKKISHDDDDSPRQSDDDLLDLVHSLGGVLNFWNTWIDSTSLHLLRTRQHGTNGTCSRSSSPPCKENNSLFAGLIHWFGTKVQAENRAQCSSTGEFIHTFRFSTNTK